jgi:hypothetical protein
LRAGGGTDFRPCFRWLEDKGIFPQNRIDYAKLV